MRYPFRMKFQDTTMLICSMILCEAQQNIRVIHKRNKEKRKLEVNFQLRVKWRKLEAYFQ